ncbi:DNA ligase D [Oceanobacillus piezotolerans]|uniref:DNA ligase (ATP) n=1 Tax=Oceanobacillus piezotolerans TaxID=2448030 RepID=A0A498DFQ5_9BACI|nr:DNA ligase D [Oceanobacillus piezotolerans]RLL42838.1 DNA ligase D [Oceanobacillus piezotolerans]
MNIMKPIVSEDIPNGEEWVYEVKYDGFRCILDWNVDGNVKLISKNNTDLTAQFPEIVTYCHNNEAIISKYLPVRLDGELVVLNNAFQANFSWIQKRGRLKDKQRIEKESQKRPAAFMAFDMIAENGVSYESKAFHLRKQSLEAFCNNLSGEQFIQYVKAYSNSNELWRKVFEYKGEGMIAKRKNSLYTSGKGHRDWFKIKNWRTIQGFVTTYNPDNGYYSFRVFNQDVIVEVGKVKHGLDGDAADTLKQLFLSNGEWDGKVYTLPPAICASVHTLDLYREELREPAFSSLLPAISANDCTSLQLKLDLAMIPGEISKTDKIFWPKQGFAKGDLLAYFREISPYMLPYLKNRALTLIRCPDGVHGESFYQKHLPDYAPPFIEGVPVEGGERLILCQDLESLIWFANHGALEYHVPFQYVTSKDPIEIVFDLDPPNREKFHLAIQAARFIKPILDDLGLHSFVKTSGNKGIQIHIPIPEGSMTYDETAVFTQAIAYTVENTHPDIFTTERMKKNRQGRLYIDYVQHGKDKTLIAPYSTRMTEEATVATPLYWEEVTDSLHPTSFTIENVLERVQELGCPFHDYYKVGQEQNLDKVLQLIRS